MSALPEWGSSSPVSRGCCGGHCSRFAELQLPGDQPVNDALGEQACHPRHKLGVATHQVAGAFAVRELAIAMREDRH